MEKIRELAEQSRNKATTNSAFRTALEGRRVRERCARTKCDIKIVSGG